LVYFLAYLKGIQDVGVFVSTGVLILIFLGQFLVCQSCGGPLRDTTILDGKDLKLTIDE